MNFSFVDKRFVLLFFVVVFVFVFWHPEIEGLSLSEEQIQQQALQQQFLVVVVVFVVVYFLLPFFGGKFGGSGEGFGVKPLTHFDLEDSGLLHSKLVSELSKNGFHELFVSGYVLSLNYFRKPYGIGMVWKHGVSKYCCVYDGTKNADKILLFGAFNFHELLRLLGVKNLKEAGDVLVKPESFSAKQWLEEGKRNNFVDVLREGLS